MRFNEVVNQIAKSARVLPGQSRFFLGLLLMVATFLAYWPALHGGLLWDDDSYISANPTLRSWRGLWEIWFKPGATCQYYPLSFSLFWAGYHLWGLNPLGYHVLNVTLHGLVAVLLWQVLERLKVRGAWLAGAIFALHPVCVMSVAWMTELKNTLSAALALGAGWAYVRFAGLGVYEAGHGGIDGRRQNAAGADWRYGALSLGLFLLAMFAKTAVSFLPLTLLLVAWWQRKRLNWREAVPLLLMLALVVAMGEMTFYIERLYGAVGMGFNLGWWERVLVSGRSFWFYLGKLFFPFRLTFVYERWSVDSRVWWQYLYPAAVAGLFVLLWRLRRVIGRGPFAAMLHFYISTAMLILITVLYMTRYTFVSDHWQYFGCLSVMTLTAAGITAGLDRLAGRSRLLKPALVGILLLVLGLSTRHQCGMYTDIETLWRTTIANNPNAFLARNNLGNILASQGKTSEAVAQFHRAIEIKPDYAEAYYNLALVLDRQGRPDEAIANYRKALEINSDFVVAHNNLGTALFKQGRMDEAAECYRRALKIDPDFGEAHSNMGILLTKQGRTDEAVAEYRKAIELNPNRAELYNNLGNLLATQGRPDEAIGQFQKALAVEPDYTGAHYNLANICFAQRQWDEAIEHYQQALKQMPDSIQVHNQLGLALLRRDKFAAAIAQFQKVLELDPRYITAQNNLAWLLATCPDNSLRNGQKAVELAQQAVQLSGGDSPEILDTLAAAYAEAERFTEAVKTARQALALSATQNKKSLAEVIQNQLKLFETHSPYHEKP